MTDLTKLAEALQTYANEYMFQGDIIYDQLAQAAALLRSAAGSDVQGLMKLHEDAADTYAALGSPQYNVVSAKKHKELESALRLALPVWRPIEEAPKDGTRVLLAIEWSDVPAIGSFSHGSWSADREHYEVSCGAFCYGGSVTSEKGFKPINYMPLPPQPKG